MCLYNTYTRDITSLPDRNKSLLHMYFLWSLGYANFKGPPLPPPLPHGGRASDLWLVTWLFATSKWTKMLVHKSGLLCKHHYYVIYSVCIYIYILYQNIGLSENRLPKKLWRLNPFPIKMAATWGIPRTNRYHIATHIIPILSLRYLPIKWLAYQASWVSKLHASKRHVPSSNGDISAQKRGIRQLSSKPALVPVPLAQPWLSALALGPGLATEYCHDDSKKQT